MAKLDLNLDAYRLIAKLFYGLRQAIREELRRKNGSSWEEGIPEELRLFLAQRRQREEGVSWFKSDGSDLLDYASFADLAEVVVATPSLLARLDWLPASGREAMLRVRFLELDTVFQRVAYARPVSEMEVEFLAGFGERMRALFESPQASGLQVPPQPPKLSSSDEGVTRKPLAQPNVPQKLAGEVTEVTSGRGKDKDLVASLKEALAQGDSKAIMRALYHEIVATADAIFKEGIGKSCPVWELVRESRWYTDNFRQLSLAPVSHFFDIVEDVKELSRSAGRDEVLEAARNRGFAQTLLQLKELFQPFLVER